MPVQRDVRFDGGEPVDFVPPAVTLAAPDEVSDFCAITHPRHGVGVEAGGLAERTLPAPILDIPRYGFFWRRSLDDTRVHFTPRIFPWSFPLPCQASRPYRELQEIDRATSYVARRRCE